MSDHAPATIYDAPRKEFPAESVWEHTAGGDYGIIGIELNATGYEETHSVGPVVRYQQLYDGSFPKGTVWIRELENFRTNFRRKA